MNKQQTIVVGGQEYDAVTGLPVSSQSSVPTPAAAKSQHATPLTPAASHLHRSTQRSATLNRKFTKRPTATRTAIVTRHAKPVHHDIKPATHAQVRKFAPHPVTSTKVMDIGPTTHPHVAKAHAASAAKVQQTPRHTPAATLKKTSVAKAVANTDTTHREHKPRFWQQRQRASGIIAATFAIVLLGGYFTYLNMPSLSVRVAAAQAGIDAAYPDYRPDGYALNGPVTFSDGKVSMNFKANASNAGFNVSQSESSWNSDAVLDNYVTPRAGSSYMPYTERGLTIYTYDNNAAWVNGGIFYTIEGDAPLSSEQIRRIATSLL